MIWSLIAQAFLVFLAYWAAVFAAGTFATIAVSQVAPDFAGNWERVIDFTVLAISLTVEAFRHSFVPTVLAIVIAEGLKIRNLATYLVIGCAVGLLTALPLDASAGVPDLADPLLQLCIASAAVGAFFYWLIAGRTAGRWLEIGGFVPERR